MKRFIGAAMLALALAGCHTSTPDSAETAASDESIPFSDEPEVDPETEKDQLTAQDCGSDYSEDQIRDIIMGRIQPSIMISQSLADVAQKRTVVKLHNVTVQSVEPEIQKVTCQATLHLATLRLRDGSEIIGNDYNTTFTIQNSVKESEGKIYTLMGGGQIIENAIAYVMLSAREWGKDNGDLDGDPLAHPKTPKPVKVAPPVVQSMFTPPKPNDNSETDAN